ncbi:ABC-2 family transporter protein [Proteiniclasticum sp.]|uniref:ABC transporter permease n=1 Tax=Proteiniclasticum sp. TaxID=2053595 RepID=UPI00289C4AB5|nr:ABC-2 family transporter protein [Proteiniclasticum sp.]
MTKYIRLYNQFLKQYIKSLIEYRADFVFGLVGFLFVQLTGVIFIRLIFSSIPSLDGWSFHEVLFIYGLAQVPRGIDHVFTDNLWLLSGRIILQGGFDKYLLRPLNPLFHLLAERFQPDGFGEIIIGAILMITAGRTLDLKWSFPSILILLSTILFATLIYTAIKLAVASISFWIKFAQSYLYMTYQLSSFTKYPLSIYPKAVKFILTFIIPFAFTGYFPGAYFLGRENFFDGILLTHVISVVSIFLAYYIWIQGIKKYESSGS